MQINDLYSKLEIVIINSIIKISKRGASGAVHFLTLRLLPFQSLGSYPFKFVLYGLLKNSTSLIVIRIRDYPVTTCMLCDVINSIVRILKIVQ